MLLNRETNTCEAIQAHLVALLDNELAPDEAAYLRTHLAVCSACAEMFEGIQKTVQTADAWQADGSDLWQALEKRIASEVNVVSSAVNNAPVSTSRLPEALCEREYLTAEQWAEALQIQRNRGGDLIDIIAREGFASPQQVFEAKARAEGLHFIDLTKHKPETSALESLPSDLARSHNVLPVKKEGNKLWVAMADPRHTAALDAVRFATRCQVAPLLAAPADLEKAIAEAYPAKVPTEGQDDLRAILTEMRALRTEIQELRGEVGMLRRLMSATQQAGNQKAKRSLPPEWMPVGLPENSGFGLL